MVSPWCLILFIVVACLTYTFTINMSKALSPETQAKLHRTTWPHTSEYNTHLGNEIT
jgi:hypothetical protein